MNNAVQAIPASSPYFDLGKFSRKITTSSEEAQIWFDRGLTWAYGFHHEEAVTCFEQVVAHDANCVMGYWGIAYSSGPHYNKPWAAFDSYDLTKSYQKGAHALKRAASILDADTEGVEKDLLLALQARYPPEPEQKALETSNQVYASAMRNVYKIHDGGDAYYKDLDIMVLTADALMNTAPWHLFESRTGLPVKSTPVLEIEEILNKAMHHPYAYSHPGLLHLIIHFFEMSQKPEVALIPSDRLRYLVPDSGHLQHMPSHIYLVIGDYRSAIDANLKAIIADDKYWAVQPDVGFYTIYRLHNIHSLIYAAMMAGQSNTALKACDTLEAALPRKVLEMTSPPMANWTEAFHSVRMHVLIRFGLWETIKNLTLPTDQTLYCTTTATIHYAKGIAYAATNDIPNALEQQSLFLSSLKNIPSTRMDFPNTVIDELAIAEAMLAGEIAYRSGNLEEAFTHLRTAIKKDDSLVYSEPWGWMIPTRHAYAALLLEQGHIEEAAKTYAQDLGLDDSIASAHQHPNNIWSLQGYHECLTKLGRKVEARIIRQGLEIAISVADIKIGKSCFCARTGGSDGTVVNGGA